MHEASFIDMNFPHALILEVELFDMLGIDFIGKFMSSYRNKHILVVLDYVSKWVEVLASPNNEGRSVMQFLKVLVS